MFICTGTDFGNPKEYVNKKHCSCLFDSIYAIFFIFPTKVSLKAMVCYITWWSTPVLLHDNCFSHTCCEKPSLILRSCVLLAT